MKEVSVAIIKKAKGGKDAYLLVTSKKYIASHGELFYPPGGHVEEGESKENAVVRELMEELCVEVTPVRVLATLGSDIEGPDNALYRVRAYEQTHGSQFG